jgi:hypothetical protein
MTPFDAYAKALADRDYAWEQMQSTGDLLVARLHSLSERQVGEERPLLMLNIKSLMRTMLDEMAEYSRARSVVDAVKEIDGWRG